MKFIIEVVPDCPSKTKKSKRPKYVEYIPDSENLYFLLHDDDVTISPIVFPGLSAPRGSTIRIKKVE